jgi:hypothetical protein
VHCGQVEAAFKREEKGRNPSKEPGSEDISGKDSSYYYFLYSPFLIFLWLILVLLFFIHVKGRVGAT